MPRLRRDVSPAKRVHDLVWRLRADEYIRPPLLDPRWVDAAAARRIEELLRERSIVLVDLGARGGVQDLKELRHLTRVLGFEPNKDECEPLTHEWNVAGYLDAKFLPVAVSGADGTRTLTITRTAGATSFLEPDWRVLRPFGEFATMFEPVASEEVPTVTLDSFAASERVDYVDFLKMDTEGSELDIIGGGERLIGRSVLALKTEVIFRRVRRGQALFREIDAALDALGFVLVAFENAYHPASIRSRAAVPAGTGDRGEWLFCDAVYLKDATADLDRLIADDPVRPLRFLLILESLGFIGYALELAELFRRSGAPHAELVAALEQAIVRRHRRHWYDRSRRRNSPVVRILRRAAGRQLYP